MDKIRVLLIVDQQPSSINRNIVQYKKLAGWTGRHHLEYDQVIATVMLNDPGTSFSRMLGVTGLMRKEPVPETLRQYLTSPPVYKNTYGCPFLGGGIYHIDIIGCDTESGIMATAFKYFDASIDFTVLANLCYSSYGKDVHDIAVEMMKMNFGAGVDVRTAMEEGCYSH